MADKSVFGIAKNESQAIMIADNLKAAGFTESDISVLCFRTKQAAGISPTSNTPRLPRVRPPAPVQVRFWVGLWAGWWASGPWQFQVWVLS
jgi:hypothetical protein